VDLERTDPPLSVWPALLLAPLLALGLQSVAYALVTPSCASQQTAALHGVNAGALVLALAMTGLAWQAWRRSVASLAPGTRITASEAGRAESRRSFLALVATTVGALSSLVIVALWLPVWFLSPCTQ
jgi:hypothetical protein